MTLNTTPYSPEDGPGVSLDDAQIAALLADAIRPLYREMVQTLINGGSGQSGADEGRSPESVCHTLAVNYLHTALCEALRTLRTE